MLTILIIIVVILITIAFDYGVQVSLRSAEARHYLRMANKAQAKGDKLAVTAALAKQLQAQRKGIAVGAKHGRDLVPSEDGGLKERNT